jgi:uncharacterized protein with WD repeat
MFPEQNHEKIAALTPEQTREAFARIWAILYEEEDWSADTLEQIAGVVLDTVGEDE